MPIQKTIFQEFFEAGVVIWFIKNIMFVWEHSVIHENDCFMKMTDLRINTLQCNTSVETSRNTSTYHGTIPEDNEIVAHYKSGACGFLKEAVCSSLEYVIHKQSK